jgi:membrane protein implicated in regulation of membrane protease activity
MTSQDPDGGRPGHHDPTSGIGGAAPARSALTLRLVLATVGLVAAVVGAVGVILLDGPDTWLWVLVGLAAVSVVDLYVVARRKARGEPG